MVPVQITYSLIARIPLRHDPTASWKHDFLVTDSTATKGPRPKPGLLSALCRQTVLQAVAPKGLTRRQFGCQAIPHVALLPEPGADVALWQRPALLDHDPGVQELQQPSTDITTALDVALMRPRCHTLPLCQNGYPFTLRAFSKDVRSICLSFPAKQEVSAPVCASHGSRV